MKRYVEVAVNVPQVMGVFHYHLPQELEKHIRVGHLVEVPFGAKKVQGVILGFVDRPAVVNTRPVGELIDEQPIVTVKQIELAKKLSDWTLAPLSACIGLMIPPGLSQTVDTKYLVVQGRNWKLDKRLSAAQKRFMELLEKRGELRGRQIARALSHHDWQRTARSLVERGYIESHSVLPPPTGRPKVVRTVQLAVPPHQALTRMDELARKGSQALARRQAMLRFLVREPGPVNVSWVYAESGGNLSDLKKLAELDLVVLGESEVWRDPLENINPVEPEPPKLTQAQQDVWHKVEKGIEHAASGEYVQPFLLHGVTGSGKTEIYLHAVEATIKKGRQAIILVPEIALTPQTVRRFISRFPGLVGLVHSKLSTGERYDTWRRARNGALSIVVGPRSALFVPLPDVGLIVVDECHDDSYYQSDKAPRYNARDAAVLYAQISSGVCVMGSATPDVVSAHRAKRGDWQYLTLPARILAHREVIRSLLLKIHADDSHYQPLENDAESIDLPPVEVVNMRQELKKGNRSIFSISLRESLKDVLSKQQQAILFLNRRGTATYVFCRDCGYTMKCPRCGTPLTYHKPISGKEYGGGGKELRCHHCGYQRGMPKRCPQCHSKNIRQYGMGTEKVEQEVRSQFPQARTLRWDWDTTRRKNAHGIILSHFANHRADVLIGTQMLAKGLDLPRVTLVGVILADVGLNLPDYRASERTFQLLTQVSGRAGRSPLGGKVVLQTFSPEHFVIRTAAKHDYQAFYTKEIAYRRDLGYPPFARLVRIEMRGRDPERVENESRHVAGAIQQWMTPTQRRQIEMIGPVPCFFERVAGNYRWQIILRGPDPLSLLRGRSLGENRIEVDPPSLL
ncbi:MAG: primosomal protein N' [Anaerolineales bacterium]|nr:primosomal protein N' [Anaerolineales bacterium]